MPAGFCSVMCPFTSVAAWATIALSLALFRQTTEALARGSPSWLQTMPERGDWAKVTVDTRQRHVAERITLSLHLIVHLNIVRINLYEIVRKKHCSSSGYSPLTGAMLNHKILLEG